MIAALLVFLIWLAIAALVYFALRWFLEQIGGPPQVAAVVAFIVVVLAIIVFVENLGELDGSLALTE